MTFYDKLEEQTTKTLTTNGAPTFSSTLNKNLDLFAVGGALRNKDKSKIQTLFSDAFHEDPEMALRNLVYIRDIRDGGLGERRTFREAVNYLLDNNHTDIVKGLVEYMPSLGRWDDVVHVFARTANKELKRHIANKLLKQLEADSEAKNKGEVVSLLAKWMPSINTSSEDTRKVANELCWYMLGGTTPKHKRAYRKMLSELRAHLDVVEVKMSRKDWGSINYSTVPSLASLKYRGAFYKNDEDRYEGYLEDLEAGKAKVNASVTYPYQIVEAYLPKIQRGDETVDTLLEEAWKSLPNYLEGNTERAIVVADTSGSMDGTPMNVAVSLAIYCAQRLEGEFKGKYISFSSKPTLNSVYPNASLVENIKRVYETEWGFSTNISKVFDLILSTAVSNKLSQKEVPDKIVIVSDMNFSEANGGYSGFRTAHSEELNETNYLYAKRKFEEAGYKIPQVVFWNVNAESTAIPTRKDEMGVALVSGLTPSIFKSVLNGDIENPEKLMKSVLLSEKYDFVKKILK